MIKGKRLTLRPIKDDDWGVLEALGLQCEGILRRSTFRDGRWCDLALYALLREEWEPAP